MRGSFSEASLYQRRAKETSWRCALPVPNARTISQIFEGERLCGGISSFIHCTRRIFSSIGKITPSSTQNPCIANSVDKHRGQSAIDGRPTTRPGRTSERPSHPHFRSYYSGEIQLESFEPLAVETRKYGEARPPGIVWGSFSSWRCRHFNTGSALGLPGRRCYTNGEPSALDGGKNLCRSGVVRPPTSRTRRSKLLTTTDTVG